ncbi:MAG: ferrochelatase [Paracoccaceae bacterium]
MRDATSETDRLAHAPAGHPAVMPAKVGILLANLGTPDDTSYWPMRRYLSEFLSDKRVVDLPDWKWQPILQLIILSFRPQKSGANYRKIWNTERGESPLLTITRDQTAAISQALSDRYGDQVMVDFCMRYGNPTTLSKVRAMVQAGCEKILFFPLYPQYAGATTATANDSFFAALTREWRPPAVRTVAEYFDHPAYISALAQSVTNAYANLDHRPDVLVTSYHGMPKRYLMQGDPYHCQCMKTTRLLRESLGWDRSMIEVSFQSIFGREEWLRPYTVEHVTDLARAGKKSIAVMAPAFSADCIETLEEVNGEIREAFLHAGGERFTYIPCLNDQQTHIAALTEIISENLGGWIK